MGKRIAVIGAGIVGAAIAYRLAEAGAEVTVVDKTGPGGDASAKSFGWINANEPEPDFYNAFRRRAIDAWRRLETDAGLDVQWGGCISWEHGDNALRAQAAALTERGHSARMITGAEIAALEPALADLPDAALYCENEGAIDPAVAARRLGDAAAALGAHRMFGVGARALRLEGGRVCGAETDFAAIDADETVLAAGLGSVELADGAGVTLPVNASPGLLVRTAPTERVLNGVLAIPGMEVRQDDAGRIVVATGLQVDQIEPDRLTDGAMAQLRRLFPDLKDLTLGEVSIGQRPMPEDGLPIIGRAAPGLILAVMHSGATLAPLVGELVAKLAMEGEADIPAALSPEGR